MIDKDMLEAMGQLIQPINDRLDKIDTRLGAVENDLGAMKEDIQSLKADNTEIRGDLQSLKADNAEIREDLQAVKADTARMVTLEKNVDLLIEGQQGMNEKFRKLDKVAEDVEEIKISVSALEDATKSQASQIQELRIAK